MNAIDPLPRDRRDEASTVDTHNLPPLIPLPEAAQLLGIPRASAYRYAQAGTLPVKRFGAGSMSSPRSSGPVRA